MGLLRHPLAVPQCFTASRADGGGFDASDAVWVEDKGALCMQMPRKLPRAAVAHQLYVLHCPKRGADSTCVLRRGNPVIDPITPRMLFFCGGVTPPDDFRGVPWYLFLSMCHMSCP